MPQQQQLQQIHSSSQQPQQQQQRRSEQRNMRMRSISRDDLNIRIIPSLNNACTILEFRSREALHFTVLNFLRTYTLIIQDILTHNTPDSVKIQLCTMVRFKKPESDDETKDWHISTAAERPEENQITIFFENKASILDEKIMNYSQSSSGWVVGHLIYVSLICSEFSDLCRLQGHSFIPTPIFIKNKQCTTNVKNNDNKCFLYSILAILKRDIVTVNRNRPEKLRPYLNELNYKEVDMPMKISNISKFERANPQLCINVIKFTPFSNEQKQALNDNSSNESDSEKSQ
jgi:hypothetical protein